MASAFKNSIAAEVGTSLVDIYTAPAATSTTVIGLSLANVTVSPITVSAKVTKGATSVFLIKDAPIPSGASLVLFGGDQKLVLETGNKISVITNTAASTDVVVSVLELT
jgi:hypothetical protein